MFFRVDAGIIAGLSFGHLSRCLAIALTLESLHETNTLFLMKDHAEGVAHAQNSGQKVMKLPIGLDPNQEREQILENIIQFDADWVVVDLPYQDLDTSYFRDLKNFGTKILFIDDTRFISPDADVILNSSILAEQETNVVLGSRINYLLGPDYFIFDDSHLITSPPRKEGIFNVLLTFGGSDPAYLTVKTLKALSEKPWPGIYFRVIFGPGYVYPKLIDDVISHSDMDIQVDHNPSSLIPFMQGCDLAICAGGRTMYELYYLNKNFLPIASAEHEAKAIKEFIKRKLIKYGLTIWGQGEFIKIFLEMLKNGRNLRA